MDDNANSDIVKSASEVLPQTVKQADEALSTVFGLFNTLMLPFKMANLFAQQKWEKFQEDMERKTADTPAENLQSPPLLIAGPTLEALKYAYDEVQLRDMYENLLASAMDTRWVDKTHPAYVKAINQMSATDAQIFKKTVQYNQFRCIGVKFTIPETDLMYTNGMPQYYVSELTDLLDPFAVSASLVNLQRLGLIDIREGTLRGQDYEILQQDEYVKSRIQLFKVLCQKEFNRDVKIETETYSISVTDYGDNFSAVCLK